VVETPEIAVVGAGVVGLCAAYALVQRGVAVRVYEPGRPGDAQSGGASRIVRHAHADPRLIAAARSSRALWREWGEELGLETISTDGAVSIGDAVGERLAALRADGGVAARAIEAGELAERLPVLAAFDGPAMIDEAGGSIRTEAAIAALAGALGARVTTDEVLAVRPLAGGGVEVVAGGGRRRHTAALVCAGRGTAALARPLGLAPPVTLSAHIRLTFAVRGSPPERLACLQDSSGAFGENRVYAAALPGNRRYAVGIADPVAATPDGALERADGLERLAVRTRAYVERALPGLDPEPVGSRACWVTQLPWGPDGVAVWREGDAHFLLGHNLFKHAPVVGVALADLATGAEPGIDLRPRALLGRAS
jgi:sarcosine oxidase